MITETEATPSRLDDILEAVAALHHHLCPRQVLGVRTGLAGAAALGVAVPQADKRLLAIVETDGCYSDGVAVATNCWVGRRTMRVQDYGKAAATFVDTGSGAAVRVAPRSGVRTEAADWAPEAADRWHGQLLGYQRMPDERLLVVRPVRLLSPVAELVSQPGLRVRCEACGEEVMNQRERIVEGRLLCRACAGETYYLDDVEGP